MQVGLAPTGDARDDFSRPFRFPRTTRKPSWPDLKNPEPRSSTRRRTPAARSFWPSTTRPTRWPRTRSVYQAVLTKSEHVRAGNFTSLSVADLILLFDLYDDSFFSGLLRRFLREDCAGAIAFRLSDRMTRAAGKTFMRRGGTPPHSWMRERIEFEIAISTFLLFQTFQDPVRTVTVGGVVCRDRLEALQRTFEHELLHLTEFLAWGMSSCAEENFRTLSRRVFAHEGVHHDLVTRARSPTSTTTSNSATASASTSAACVSPVKSTGSPSAPRCWSKTPPAGCSRTARRIRPITSRSRSSARTAGRGEATVRVLIAHFTQGIAHKTDGRTGPALEIPDL